MCVCVCLCVVRAGLLAVSLFCSSSPFMLLRKPFDCASLEVSRRDPTNTRTYLKLSLSASSVLTSLCLLFSSCMHVQSFLARSSVREPAHFFSRNASLLVWWTRCVVEVCLLCFVYVFQAFSQSSRRVATSRSFFLLFIRTTNLVAVGAIQ